MIYLKGEVRKTLDSGYTNKSTGERIQQAKLILEPEQGSQNYEVILTNKHLKAGVRELWDKLIGQTVYIAVSIYVNHDYHFYKYTAAGDAEPLKGLKP